MVNPDNSSGTVPKKLPIHAYKETFLRLLADNNTLVVVGETGSGKTTQIPKFCLEYLRKDGSKLGVACTQPRRIAAMSVAARVSKEMKVGLGQEVGYSVRFDSRASPKTVIKYLTDGMLLREAMLDGLLKSYGIILIDEAHERTLQTEILFGVLKRALLIRNHPGSESPQLKVVVMSATIDVKLFREYLFNSHVLVVKGRQHQVLNMFAAVPQPDTMISCLTAVFQVHRTCDPGDVLVFCSGQDEIHTLVSLCKRVSRELPKSLQNIHPLPLYASLPPKSQMKVLAQTQSEDRSQPMRKIIFSTNVAETSITIPNIKYVIDTGFVKYRTFCPNIGLESLKVIRISKAQAAQRSGRAGRTCSGTCYRLYTKSEYEQMAIHQKPEIQRCNLDGVILQMISIGISDIKTFEFLEKPDDSQIEASLKFLVAIDAIKSKTKCKQENGNSSQTEPARKKVRPTLNQGDVIHHSYELTNLGKKLGAFPLSPSMSRILIAANHLGCMDDVLTIISLLYVESIFHILPNSRSQADAKLEKFRTNEGDLIMLLRVYRAFKKVASLNRSGLKHWCKEHFVHIKNLKLAISVRKQLYGLCKSIGMNQSSSAQDTSVIRRAFVYGLFNNVAQLCNGKYQNKDSTEVMIHPSSCLFRARPECILYVELVETNNRYMRNCSLVDMTWIREAISGTLS